MRSARPGEEDGPHHVRVLVGADVEADRSGQGAAKGRSAGKYAIRSTGRRKIRVCQRSAMDELEIIRLNIERYQRMLETESNETTRQSIQRMLAEFEAKFQAGRSSRPLMRHD